MIFSVKKSDTNHIKHSNKFEGEEEYDYRKWGGRFHSVNELMTTMAVNFPQSQNKRNTNFKSLLTKNTKS